PDADDQHRRQVLVELQAADDVDRGAELTVRVGQVQRRGRLLAGVAAVADEDLELVADRRGLQVVDLGARARRDVILRAVAQGLPPCGSSGTVPPRALMSS